jgi:hypothetical protein
MPFIEGWTAKESSWNRLRGVMGISILAGIFLILFKGLDIAFAAFMMQTTSAQAEVISAYEAVPPFWQGFLAAFSAAITEETMFRLFGLSLTAWLGSLLFRSRSGRPAPWLLWTANILVAILFGYVHLLMANHSGIQLDAMIVLRTLIINGVGGVVFGWLYWSFGLESAMLAHFSADVIRHAFVPLVIQQADPTRSIVFGAIIVLAIVLAACWSISAIRRDRKQISPSGDSSAARMVAGYSHPTV